MSAKTDPAEFLDTTRPAAPYPGLRPFDSKEWSIFFGRERMIDDVIDRLAAHKLVLIHGASGSGKSSLVRAGVLPKLARRHLRYGVPWLPCSIRPSGGPLWNLAKELAALEGKGADLDRIQAIAVLFSKESATLSSVVSELDGLTGQRLCILVDQFEELFRFAKETSREEAELFVSLLARQIADDDANNFVAAHGRNADLGGSATEVHVVITMRSEFLGECARFDGLAEAINQAQYLVPRMDHAALRRAICRPAALYGGEVTPDLAQRMIGEMAGRDDELPLIQHGLMLLWREATQALQFGHRDRIVLDADTLEVKGGLINLLSEHADSIVNKVAPDRWRKTAVERMFRALTDINAEGQGIRRPQAFRDLLAVTNVDALILRPIIDAFRAEGVSFLTPYAHPAAAQTDDDQTHGDVNSIVRDQDVIADDTVIDISHEALIRCWRSIAEQTQGWLKQEFSDGLLWRSLLFDATRFASNRNALLPGATIEERRDWFRRQSEPWCRRYGGEWTLVQELIEASFRAADKAREEIERTVADAQRTLDEGEEFFRRGSFVDALKSYTQAFDVNRRLLMAEPANAIRQRDLANVAVKVGDTQQALDDLPSALKAYLDSLAIRERLAASDPDNPDWQYDVARSHAKAGDILLIQGKRLDALRSYQHSLEIRERLSQSVKDDARLQHNLVDDYGKVADLLAAQGDLQGALASREKAFAAEQHISRFDPNDPPWHAFWQSNIKIGDLLAQLGKLREAAVSYRNSLTIAERPENLSSDSTSWHHRCAVSSYKLGDVQIAQGRPSEALQSYQTSLTTICTLIQIDPDQFGALPSLDAYKPGELPVLRSILRDEAVYRDGIAIAERLRRTNPDNVRWQQTLALSYRALGDYEKANHKLVAAQQTYRHALDVVEHLVNVFPDNVRQQRELAMSHASLALVFASQNEPEKALEELRRGRDIYQKFGNDVHSERMAITEIENVQEQSKAVIDWFDAQIRNLEPLTSSSRPRRSYTPFTEKGPSNVSPHLAEEFDARDRHLFGEGPKRMLALDGGGVRGAITVAFLEEIEKILLAEESKLAGPAAQGRAPQPPDKKVRLGDYFDLVGGTSTGSLIATALALGYTIDQIKAFYLERAAQVFKKPFWRLPGLQPKFDARALIDEINAIVKDRRLDSPELITGLAIVSKRMDTGSPWILANNKKAPYWEDGLPTPESRGHIGNRHYKLGTLVRASTAAPHYFDPEIIAIADNAPEDPLGQVKANLSGRPLLSLLLSKVRAIYGMVSKSGPSADTHGLFVDGGVTPHNNPAMALLTMARLKRLGLCWPLGSENLTIVSIGTGTYRSKVSFGELGWAGPLRLAIGALMSVIGDCGNQALAQMQWLGECMTCWTINSEVRTMCDDAPPGGKWFRFARYDLRLEKTWLSKNLELTLTDKEIAHLQGMDDPGIIETLYGMAREAAQKQVKREHFFPDKNAPPFTCCGGADPNCPRFIGP